MVNPMNFFSHSVSHSMVHFAFDVGLGMRSKNPYKEILVGSFFFSFVGLCFDLEELMLAKLAMSFILVLVSVFCNLEYEQFGRSMATFLHDSCHLMAHWFFGFLLEFYFSYDIEGALTYSVLVSFFFCLGNLLWQTKGLEVVRIVFAVLLLAHVWLYYWLDIVIFAGVVKMIEKLY